MPLSDRQASACIFLHLCKFVQKTCAAGFLGLHVCARSNFFCVKFAQTVQRESRLVSNLAQTCRDPKSYACRGLVATLLLQEPPTTASDASDRQQRVASIGLRTSNCEQGFFVRKRRTRGNILPRLSPATPAVASSSDAS